MCTLSSPIGLESVGRKKDVKGRRSRRQVEGAEKRGSSVGGKEGRSENKREGERER
jgi:hypothetical protein